jgi:hypothetical protein
MAEMPQGSIESMDNGSAVSAPIYNTYSPGVLGSTTSSRVRSIQYKGCWTTYDDGHVQFICIKVYVCFVR